MKNVRRTLPVLAILSLLFFIVSCKDKNESLPEEKSFPLIYSATYQLMYGEVLKVSFEENKEINYVALFLDGELLKEWKNMSGNTEDSIDITAYGMGAKSFTLKAKDKEGRIYEEYQTIHVISDVVPEALNAEVLAMYPHNTKDFTQGLEIVDGFLYEGTGDPDHIGVTKVMQKDLKTGNVLNEVSLEGNYFGEGITILNDKLYQLTWTSQKCFVYEFPSLFKTGNSFTYTGEGWGLTNDGSQLIMSDGSERIYFRDPSTFGLKRTIEVYTNEGPVKGINELEYIEGKIYANVYTKNQMVIIDPETGVVTGRIDASILALDYRKTGEVLNGIAYKNSTKQLFVTGKNWPNLLEIGLVKE